ASEHGPGVHGRVRESIPRAGREKPPHPHSISAGRGRRPAGIKPSRRHSSHGGGPPYPGRERVERVAAGAGEEARRRAVGRGKITCSQLIRGRGPSRSIAGTRSTGSHE